MTGGGAPTLIDYVATRIQLAGGQDGEAKGNQLSTIQREHLAARLLAKSHQLREELLPSVLDLRRSNELHTVDGSLAAHAAPCPMPARPARHCK